MLDWDEWKKNHGSQCSIRHFDHFFHVHNKIESRQFRMAFYYFGIWFLYLVSFHSILPFPFFLHSYSRYFILLSSRFMFVHSLVHPSKLNKYNLVISVSASYTTLVIYVLGHFLDRSMMNIHWSPHNYMYIDPPYWIDGRFLWLFPDIISLIMYVYLHMILNHIFFSLPLKRLAAHTHFKLSNRVFPWKS